MSLCLIWILSACTPVALPPTPVMPAVLVILHPTSLGFLTPAMNACAREVGGLAIALREVPKAPLPDQPGLVSLAWSGRETPGFTYQLGFDELVVIVHPSNPVSTLSSAGLRALFSGGIRKWQDLSPEQCGNCRVNLLLNQPVEPWGYPVGEELQPYLEGGLGMALSTNWIHTAPDPQAMRAAVSRNPGALGFLPRRWVDASVKVAAFHDLPVLRLPLLATSFAEPAGKERDFFLCLQEKIVRSK